jgi:hypothetical protein
MIKETKFFRMQATKAERLARAMADDDDIALDFASLAQAYRSQADALKKSNKERAKKKNPKGKKPKHKAANKPRVKKSKKKFRKMS